VCIRYRGNVSKEPLPSSDSGIFTEPLPGNYKGIFTEPLPSNDRGIHRHGQQRDLISLILFFQNKESRLKIASHKKEELEGDTQTDGPLPSNDFISLVLFIFFEIRKVG
jgi:hypothetical protein